MSFFAELKRRNVFRVGIAYVIVGWLGYSEHFELIRKMPVYSELLDKHGLTAD